MITDAVLSDCGTYRYALMRRWEQGHPLRFVMLNPSIADATVDDPTIRRCVSFARREGYAALIVLNLYAYRATDPKALLTCGDDPVGPNNDNILWSHLLSSKEGANPVVAAWGVNAKPDRVQRVLDLVPGVDWRCLGTTKQGHRFTNTIEVINEWSEHLLRSVDKSECCASCDGHSCDPPRS